MTTTTDKLGVDDCLVKFGPEVVLNLFEQAEPFKTYSPFEMTDNGVWWIDNNPDPDKRRDEWLCGPLAIEAVTMDTDGFNHGRLLSWSYDNGRGRHTWPMP